MDKNDCCTLHFKICRLQLNLLQHQDDSLAKTILKLSTVLPITHNGCCTMGLCSNDINILLHPIGSPWPAMLPVDVAHFFPVQCFGKYTET